MAEAAGLAIGVAGLAGLFSSCVDCFDMIQMGRARLRDVAVLHQRLDNQKMRFLIWGESLGLHQANVQQGSLDHLSPTLRQHLEKTMKLIVDLFKDSESLRLKYGLREETAKGSRPFLPQGGQGNAFAHALQRARSKLHARSLGMTSPGALKWVMSDRRQFKELADNLKSLIDDLESMTMSEAHTRICQTIVEYEIEELPEDDLEVVTEARSEDGVDALSDAASLRLERISMLSSDVASARSSYSVGELTLASPRSSNGYYRSTRDESRISNQSKTKSILSNAYSARSSASSSYYSARASPALSLQRTTAKRVTPPAAAAPPPVNLPLLQNFATKSGNSRSALSLKIQSAIRSNNQALLGMIISNWPKEVDPNFMTPLGTSLQMLAASDRYHPMLVQFLKLPIVDVNYNGTRGGTPALLTALKTSAWQNFFTILFHPRTNINAVDNDGQTALMHAARQGNLSVITALTHFPQVEVTNVGGDGLDAIDHAFQSGNVDCATFLIAKYKQKLEKDPTYQSFIKLKETELVLRDGPSNLSDDLKAWRESTLGGAKGFEILLNVAAQQGNVALVHACLESEGINLDFKTEENGWTPIHHAANSGFPGVIQALLSASNSGQVDINATDNEGATALLLAAKKGHLEAIRMLLNCDRVDSDARDNTGFNAYMLAKAFNQTHVFTLIDFMNEEMPQTINTSGATPLMAATALERMRQVEYITSNAHKTVNAQDQSGRTALYVAAMMGFLDIVRCLLACEDIDVDVPGPSQVTPLLAAVEGGHGLVVCELIAHRPESVLLHDASCRTPLSESISQSFTAITEFLLRVETARQIAHIGQLMTTQSFIRLPFQSQVHTRRAFGLLATVQPLSPRSMARVANALDVNLEVDATDADASREESSTVWPGLF